MGIRRGEIESLIRLAKRSSIWRGSATPRTCRVRSSTPTRSAPPAVFANATIDLSAPSGEERASASRSARQGETLGEARRNLREAVELIIESNRALAQDDAVGADVIREPLNLSA